MGAGPRGARAARGQPTRGLTGGSPSRLARARRTFRPRCGTSCYAGCLTLRSELRVLNVAYAADYVLLAERHVAAPANRRSMSRLMAA